MRAVALVLIALAIAGCGRAPAPVTKVSATPAAVASTTPQVAACPEPTPPKDEHGKPWPPTLQKPPPISREFRDIVSASTTVMTVKGLKGQLICVDLYIIDGISDYQFSDAAHRFFGFEKTDEESNGHYVIDRAMSGNAAIIETGTQPLFSDDDIMFASQQWGDGMDGDLDKLGIWAVGPSGTTQLAELDEPTNDNRFGHWDSIGWSGNRCFELSALTNDEVDSAEYGDDPHKWPGHRFRVVPVGKTWRLQPGKCPR